MINKLLSNQIPQFWDLIKYAIAKVYNLDEKKAHAIFTQALTELEADNYQCFIKRTDDENKTVISLVITHITTNKWTQLKALNLVCLYSFKYSDMEGWQNFFDFVKEFGIQQGCVQIVAESNNARVWEITEYLGFDEFSRIFVYTIGGK